MFPNHYLTNPTSIFMTNTKTGISNFLSIILLTLSLQNCKPAQHENLVTAVEVADDEKAILQVIENESRAFYKKDYASWANYYTQTPKVHWLCVETGVTLRADGWNDLSKFVSDWMKENPDPIDYDAADYKNTDIQTTIQGDLAFVTMKSSNKQADGGLRQLINSRTMVKENGQWKILSMTSYPSDAPEGSSANVYVHKGS